MALAGGAPLVVCAGASGDGRRGLDAGRVDLFRDRQRGPPACPVLRGQPRALHDARPEGRGARARLAASAAGRLAASRRRPSGKGLPGLRAIESRGATTSRAASSAWFSPAVSFGRFAPPGHLIFVRGGSVLAVPCDPRTLEPSGPHFALPGDVMIADVARVPYLAAAAGVLAYAAGESERCCGRDAGVGGPRRSRGAPPARAGKLPDAHALARWKDRRASWSPKGRGRASSPTTSRETSFHLCFPRPGAPSTRPGLPTPGGSCLPRSTRDGRACTGRPPTAAARRRRSPPERRPGVSFERLSGRPHARLHAVSTSNRRHGHLAPRPRRQEGASGVVRDALQGVQPLLLARRRPHRLHGRGVRTEARGVRSRRTPVPEDASRSRAATAAASRSGRPTGASSSTAPGPSELLAVRIVRSPTLSASAPRLVLKTRPVPVRRREDNPRQYAISPDGKRFLFIKPLETKRQSVTQLELVTDWPAVFGRPAKP